MSRSNFKGNLLSEALPLERRPDGTLYGMAEAERQVRVARKLYEQAGQKVRWEKLSIRDRRVYIDRACDPRFDLD